MGCWNKTCGLSNLHIYAGDPVYVFLLEDRRSMDNCYTTSLYRPLLLPFLSEYNDYGGGENSSGPAFNVIMDALREYLVELEVGENTFHDIEVKRDGFNEEKFFEAVHENRLLVSGISGDDDFMTFTMFRKDIFDHILENRVIEKYVGDGKGTGGWRNNYIYYKFEDIIATVRPFIEKLANDIKSNSNSKYGMCFVTSPHTYRNDFLAASWMLGDDYRFSRLVDIRILLPEMISDGCLDQAEALLTEHIRGVFIDRFMTDTRKTWIPGGHEGSQDADASAYHVLIDSMTNALAAEDARWD